MPAIKELSYKKFKKYYKKNLEFKNQLNSALLTSFSIILPTNLTLNMAIQLDVFGCVKLMLIKNKENYPESKKSVNLFYREVMVFRRKIKSCWIWYFTIFHECSVTLCSHGMHS